MDAEDKARTQWRVEKITNNRDLAQRLNELTDDDWSIFTVLCEPYESAHGYTVIAWKDVPKHNG